LAGLTAFVLRVTPLPGKDAERALSKEDPQWTRESGR
jgi:hypothetical protein